MPSPTAQENASSTTSEESIAKAKRFIPTAFRWKPRSRKGRSVWTSVEVEVAVSPRGPTLARLERLVSDPAQQRSVEGLGPLEVRDVQIEVVQTADTRHRLATGMTNRMAESVS